MGGGGAGVIIRIKCQQELKHKNMAYMTKQNQCHDCTKSMPLLDRINVEQEDIDKATEILDMISFTKEDGRDVVVVKIGENVELKIYK